MARERKKIAAPKTANGSPKRFHEWNLAQWIDVACEVGVLKAALASLAGERP